MNTNNFIVYRIECDDGLSYIGKTNDIRQRMYSHKKSTRFKGRGIKLDILSAGLTNNAALLLESKYISLFNTHKNGLNLTPDGESLNGDEKFNTLGVSYVKGKKWYNNGVIHKIFKEGEQTEGFIRGRMKHTVKRGERHSEEVRRRWSKIRKGKVHSTSKSPEVIRELFILYKSKPFIPGIGEPIGASKTAIATYERSFARIYAVEFGMTNVHLYNLITRQGGLAWNHIWREVYD